MTHPDYLIILTSYRIIFPAGKTIWLFMSGPRYCDSDCKTKVKFIQGFRCGSAAIKRGSGAV